MSPATIVKLAGTFCANGKVYLQSSEFIMRLLLFGKEQFVNPYHDYFDDHVSRNGEQDAATEEIAAYKDEGNRGQRVNIKLFP